MYLKYSTHSTPTEHDRAVVWHFPLDYSSIWQADACQGRSHFSGAIASLIRGRQSYIIDQEESNSSSICTRTRNVVFPWCCAPGTRVLDWRIKMAKFPYQGVKWDKGVAEYKKVSATIPGGSAGLKNLEFCVNKFIVNADKDFIELYYGLSADYYSIARGIYLCDPQNPTCFDYIFMAGLSFAIMDTLIIHHYPTKRKIFNDFPIEQQEMKYSLIATDQTNFNYLLNGNDIISYTLTGQYQKAKKIMDQIEKSEDWVGYLIDYCNVKSIYDCIFNKDQDGFNLALVARIKKYRKNMVGYFPIIDIASIALIKMAKMQGIACTVDVIEVPSFFINGDYQIDGKEVASNMPFYEDVMKLLKDNNWLI